MMDGWRGTRRDFGKAVAVGAAALATGASVGYGQQQEQFEREEPGIMDKEFFVRPKELTLRCLQKPGSRALSFAHYKGEPEAWRKACRAKLIELLGYTPPSPGKPRRLRTIEHEGVTIEAWVMEVDANLSMPAYVLIPESGSHNQHAVMAIHGHGEAEPCVGLRDDYHHRFALRTAQAGHLVLCPELRGFGALADMARSDEDHWLNYWGGERAGHFTLVTDGFLYGKTVIGQTIEDLLRWEDWLAQTRGVRTFDSVGISYGGDLAITYPALSKRVRSIYTSGSMGSFAPIFARCCNAPAHCVPGVLQWMDRSDIAGLSAPLPIRLHYGERDVPGPHNASASYNETVEPALKELRAIYQAFGAEDQVSLRVTPGTGHEYEIEDLLTFLTDETS
jgi:dienelactone hydrolase